jgi:hypothetical protein
MNKEERLSKIREALGEAAVECWSDGHVPTGQFVSEEANRIADRLYSILFESQDTTADDVHKIADHYEEVEGPGGQMKLEPKKA